MPLPGPASRQGVGFLSEDRKTEGLALNRSIEDNVTYSSLKRHARHGWLRLKERRAEVARWLERLHVTATGPGQSVGGLSGGNQQKVALARLLHQQADVLLLDEPTRGIDVGSKAEIYRLIGELAAEGKAILVVSSYLPELFGICDRIAVMVRGELCEARATVAVDRARIDGSRHAYGAAGCERGRIASGASGSFLRISLAFSNRKSDVAAKLEPKQQGRSGFVLRGTLGWAWSVFGPFLGLVLITLLFAGLTRETGHFFTLYNWQTIAAAIGHRGDGCARHDDHHDRRWDRPVGRVDRRAGDGLHCSGDEEDGPESCPRLCVSGRFCCRSRW